MAKFSIKEIAGKSDYFKTFLSVLTISSLVDLFNGENNFTVFAPTDSAFELLPVEKFKHLSSPEGKEKLKSILKYHIVKGRYDALDLEDIDKLDALNGVNLKIAENEGYIYVNNAKVIKEDIEAKDGMIHIIDEVLIPCDINF